MVVLEPEADWVHTTFLAVMTSSQRQPVREWEGLRVRVAVRSALDELRNRCRARRRHCPLETKDITSANTTPGQVVLAGEVADRLREGEHGWELARNEKPAIGFAQSLLVYVSLREARRGIKISSGLVNRQRTQLAQRKCGVRVARPADEDHFPCFAPRGCSPLKPCGKGRGESPE
jgi:hypothetical protein